MLGGTEPMSCLRQPNRIHSRIAADSFRISLQDRVAVPGQLLLMLTFFPALAWVQELGQVVAEDQKSNSGDAPAIEALTAYARALVEQSDWPIEFEDLIVITSRSGGYQLNFRTSVEDAREDGLTPREEGYLRLTYEEKVERWQALVCSPMLLESVERESFTVVLSDNVSRRNLWSGRYACDSEAD
jgi:hypothetical protein